MENMFEIRKSEVRRKQFVEENSDIADKIINTNSSVELSKNEEEIVDKNNSIKQIQEYSTPEEIEISQKENTTSLISTLLEEDGRTKDSFTYYLDKSINSLAASIVGNNNRKKSKLINLLLKSAILTNEDIKQMAIANKDIQKHLDNIKEN